MIRSPKPSPFTSPALLTETPDRSNASIPSSLKPLLPLSELKGSGLTADSNKRGVSTSTVAALRTWRRCRRLPSRFVRLNLRTSSQLIGDMQGTLNSSGSLHYVLRTFEHHGGDPTVNPVASCVKQSLRLFLQYGSVCCLQSSRESCPVADWRVEQPGT